MIDSFFHDNATCGSNRRCYATDLTQYNLSFDGNEQNTSNSSGGGGGEGRLGGGGGGVGGAESVGEIQDMGRGGGNHTQRAATQFAEPNMVSSGTQRYSKAVV